MIEIDIYTRVSAARPFDIKTIRVNTQAEALQVVKNQSEVFKKQYKNPRQISNGRLLQFKTNRGNVYAEIEVNNVQD